MAIVSVFGREPLAVREVGQKRMLQLAPRLLRMRTSTRSPGWTLTVAMGSGGLGTISHRRNAKGRCGVHLPVTGPMANSLMPAWIREGSAGSEGALIPSRPTHSDSSDVHLAPVPSPGTVNIPDACVNGPPVIPYPDQFGDTCMWATGNGALAAGSAAAPDLAGTSDGAMSGPTNDKAATMSTRPAGTLPHEPSSHRPTSMRRGPILVLPPGTFARLPP